MTHILTPGEARLTQGADRLATLEKRAMSHGNLNTADTSARRVRSVHDAYLTLEGDGFEVRRAIPSQQYEAVGPFIFLDHFGPIDVKPGEAKGASAHHHAGIETLTLLLDGISWHKDSLRNLSSTRPGEYQ